MQTTTRGWSKRDRDRRFAETVSVKYWELYKRLSERGCLASAVIALEAADKWEDKIR